jgi:hypothetical protein
MQNCNKICPQAEGANRMWSDLLLPSAIDLCITPRKKEMGEDPLHKTKKTAE